VLGVTSLPVRHSARPKSQSLKLLKGETFVVLQLKLERVPATIVRRDDVGRFHVPDSSA
jgi:hypothetical protein